MITKISAAPATALAVALLGLSLQGCIDSNNGSLDEDPGDPGNPDPTVCTHLPEATVAYKGGNTWGEELTVSLDPATMAYVVTIDASLQRTAGTTRSGTLTPLAQECTYASDESGAVFTLAAGGILQGGVNAPSGSAFAPLLAFRNTFQNVDTPTVFNPVAEIYNLIGTLSDGSTMQGYGASGRLRNAGTFQLCVDPTAGFMIYAASCANTEKGYISYNSTRGAFDLFTTDPAGSAVTTGGTLTGSMVIGLVGSGETAVPLQLVRDSATHFGLRLYTPQATLASGSADGSYAIVDSGGSNAMATLSGADYSRSAVAATLAYDTPVIGVVKASGALAGYLLHSGGILGFIPSAGSPAFELGVLN